MRDKKELDGVMKKGTVMMVTVGFIMWLLCLAMANPIARLFLHYNPDAVNLTTQTLCICSFGFVLSGVSMFVSSFFTGLDDAFASAGIAIVFSFIGPLCAALLITEIFGGNVIWYAIPVSSIVTVIICLILIKTRYAKISLDENEE